jgi:hypothetical protein
MIYKYIIFTKIVILLCTKSSTIDPNIHDLERKIALAISSQNISIVRSSDEAG